MIMNQTIYPIDLVLKHHRLSQWDTQFVDSWCVRDQGNIFNHDRWQRGEINVCKWRRIKCWTSSARTFVDWSPAAAPFNQINLVFLVFRYEYLSLSTLRRLNHLHNIICCFKIYDLISDMRLLRWRTRYEGATINSKFSYKPRRRSRRNSSRRKKRWWMQLHYYWVKVVRTLDRFATQAVPPQREMMNFWLMERLNFCPFFNRSRSSSSNREIRSYYPPSGLIYWSL